MTKADTVILKAPLPLEKAASKISTETGAIYGGVTGQIQQKEDGHKKQKQEESPSQEEEKQSEKLEDLDTSKNVSGRPADFGKDDKIFTREAYEKALARMRSKNNQFHVGINPEMLFEALAILGFYLETGTRKSADFLFKIRDESKKVY